MQFFILAFVSFLAAVAAQNPNIPSCATECIKTLPASCQMSDIACICGNAEFITNVSCCVFKDCPASDQAAALAYARKLCSSGGVTLTNTAATCLSTTTSATSSTSTGVAPKFTAIAGCLGAAAAAAVAIL